jgi:hypothetical protein
MSAKAIKQRNVITDKVVVPKTGKTMADWFEVLDKKGAKKLDSHGIYDLVTSIERLKPLGQWNCGLLSTSYQWDRGLRERGAKKNGFEISVSKTIAVPVEMLYSAWLDDGLRKKWLPEQIAITKSTENKSVRVLWSDNSTRLSVDLYPKGAGKSQVVIQHLKIPDSDMAAQMKEYWAERLNILKGILEGV